MHYVSKNLHALHNNTENYTVVIHDAIFRNFSFYSKRVMLDVNVRTHTHKK